MPGKPFQPNLMFVGKARSLPKTGVPLDRLQPHKLTLNMSGKPCQGQTLQLIMDFCIITIGIMTLGIMTLGILALGIMTLIKT